VAAYCFAAKYKVVAFNNMKRSEFGQDQLQRICDVLRRDTLEPALVEARRIEEEARSFARKLTDETLSKCQEQERASRQMIEQQKKIFEDNIKQSLAQALGLLRQEIEEQLFSKALSQLLASKMQDADQMALVLDALIAAIKKDGLDADIEVTLGQALDKQQLVQALAPAIREYLKDAKFAAGLFSGGLSVHLRDEHLVIDVSDEALRELLARFLRKDFRQMLFA